MWNKVSKVLDKKAKRRGRNEILIASLICYLATKISKGRFLPISFKNGILTIRAESQVEAADISAQRTQIIAKINEKIGREAVKDIKAKVKD